VTEETTIRRLTDVEGLSREEAERRLEDDDLWLVAPEQRFVWEPEEAERQWETAYDFAASLARGFTDSDAINHATCQLLWDMRERSREALRRARERAEEA
jgi:hypothetical protein